MIQFIPFEKAEQYGGPNVDTNAHADSDTNANTSTDTGTDTRTDTCDDAGRPGTAA